MTECGLCYFTFTSLWRSLLPSVILRKPMTDLCWKCQKGSTAIQRSANLSMEEKSAAVVSVEEHLRVVQVKPSFYTASCEECSRSIRASFSPPPPSSHIPPNSNPIKAHYSFDNSQQVCPTIQEKEVTVLRKKIKIFLYYRYTSLQTQCNQAPSTFSPRESALCLEYTVRPYLTRLTSSRMSRVR